MRFSDLARPLPADASKHLVFWFLWLAVGLCSARIVEVLNGPFASYWSNDFRFFWLAGKFWNSGLSPYLPPYMQEGLATFGSFTAPFYYPPSMRLFASLLALAPTQEAGILFFGLNMLLLAVSCAVLARIAAKMGAGLNERALFPLFLLCAFIFMRHPMVIASIGQFTIVFLSAACALLYGVVFKKRWPVALGLAVLLMKPHFGLGLLALVLLNRETRTSGLIALSLNAVMSAAGLAENPMASLQGFLANVAAYTDHPLNRVTHSGGLSFLLSLAGIELPLAGTFAVLLAGPALLKPWENTREAFFAVVATIVWGLYVTPTHATDYVMLTPVLALAVVTRPFSRAAVIFLALLIATRTHEITTLFGLEHGWPRVQAMTVMNTSALTALVVILSMQVRFRRPALPRLAHPTLQDAM